MPMETFDINTFRAAAPYIYAHQASTSVITLPTEIVTSDSLGELIQDLALMQTLGIKLIIVFDTGLFRARSPKVVDHNKMIKLQHLIGEYQTRLESLFSTGLVNTPMAGMKLTTVSGNFVLAKPVGIVDGIDQQYRGEVRRIETHAIRQQLEVNNIVLLSSLGYSPSGECFYIDKYQIASTVAASMPAEKLIFLTEEKNLLDHRKQRIKFLTLSDAQALLKRRKTLSAKMRMLVELSLQACYQQVERVHILSNTSSGVLLQELFSQDGAGTMITHDAYDDIRSASINDVGGIQSLIKPLEDEGILLVRSSEQIERDLKHYVVIERDGFVLACGALLPYDNQYHAECACIAVHPEFQKEGHGKRLIKFLENKAKQLGCDTVFAMTTRSLHWFYDNGYQKSQLNALPADRQKAISSKRNSRVLVKKLA